MQRAWLSEGRVPSCAEFAQSNRPPLPRPVADPPPYVQVEAHADGVRGDEDLVAWGGGVGGGGVGAWDWGEQAGDAGQEVEERSQPTSARDHKRAARHGPRPLRCAHPGPPPDAPRLKSAAWLRRAAGGRPPYTKPTERPPPPPPPRSRLLPPPPLLPPWLPRARRGGASPSASPACSPPPPLPPGAPASPASPCAAPCQGVAAMSERSRWSALRLNATTQSPARGSGCSRKRRRKRRQHGGRPAPPLRPPCHRQARGRRTHSRAPNPPGATSARPASGRRCTMSGARRL
jgi:hypothetical protein